jgi:hypothetical protein
MRLLDRAGLKSHRRVIFALLAIRDKIPCMANYLHDETTAFLSSTATKEDSASGEA